MNVVEKVTQCFLCGKENAALVQKGARYAPSLDVCRCLECGLVRLQPLPSEEDLARFYTEAYRAEYEPGVDAASAHRDQLPEARARVERLKGFLSSTTELLEIGSSSGAFLASIAPFVRRAAGVEPAKAHREWAQKKLAAEIHEGLDGLSGRSFDLIVLFHVLEHVRRPDEFLKKLLSLLSPEGRIVVEVPNVDDALLALYKVPSFGPFYYQDAHLWYFSKDTLERTVRAAGASAAIRGIQRYDLSNHLRWLLTGKPGGLGFYKHVFPKSLDEAYGEALANAGHADTLWAVIQPETTSRRP